MFVPIDLKRKNDLNFINIFFNFLARLLINPPFTALPNLILNQKMFEEKIQWHCSSETIAYELQIGLTMNRIDFDMQQALLRSCFENKK